MARYIDLSDKAKGDEFRRHYASYDFPALYADLDRQEAEIRKQGGRAMQRRLDVLRGERLSLQRMEHLAKTGRK